MRELFVAFRSRSEAVRYYEMLLTYRLPAKIINTPSSAGVGCGLSIKMFEKNMSLAKTVLERGKFRSFIGFYNYTQNGTARKI